MVTKYNTGETVYIPVKIKSAAEYNNYELNGKDKKIFYSIVEDKDYIGAISGDVLIPEDVIVKAQDAIGSRREIGEVGIAKINVKIGDMSPVRDMLTKAKKINELMNEAMELADSIANTDLDLRVNAIFDGKATELARITTE